MNREDYRKAFDELSFSADFQERTADLLQQRARELEKERTDMTISKTKKIAVLVAACIALLAVSVSAAYMWLTPAQVAEEHNQPLLAEAFQGPDAIAINETVESGDFSITLLGLVSGKNLDVLNQDLEKDHTYSVLALRRLDGTALTNENHSLTQYTMTPLVAGCSPSAVNIWTLGAGCSGMAKDGVYYYLLDTRSIEMFADRTVYMAFYEGFVPNNSIFTVAEDGTIAFAEDFAGVQALFTLPLDPAKADRAAADAFVESTGMNGWTNERSDPEEEWDIERRETEDGEEITLRPKPEGGEALEFATEEELAAYAEAERANLQADLDRGTISRETYDKSIRDLEEALQGVRDGTLAAAILEDGGLFTTTVPTEGVRFEVTQDGVIASNDG